MKRLAIGLFVLAPLCTIGATWAWALRGMSGPIGGAWTTTVCVLLLSGTVVAAMTDKSEWERKR